MLTQAPIDASTNGIQWRVGAHANGPQLRPTPDVFLQADRCWNVAAVEAVDGVAASFRNPNKLRTFRDTDSMASSIGAAPKLLIV